MQHAEHVKQGELENALPLSEAVSLFPVRGGKPVTIATLKRRIKVGCRGVKLYGFLSGSCWYTTREAVERFHDELTLRELGPANHGQNDAATRRKSSRAAMDYLKRLGIGSGNKNKRQGKSGKSAVTT